MTALIALPGFPIQKSPGHSSFDNSPELIAVCCVFHRLSAPRHPPCALYSLIIHPTPSEWGRLSCPKRLNHSRGVNDSALDDLSMYRRSMLRRYYLNESFSLIHSPISLSLSSFQLFNFRPVHFLNPSNERRLYARRDEDASFFSILFYSRSIGRMRNAHRPPQARRIGSADTPRHLKIKMY